MVVGCRTRRVPDTQVVERKYTLLTSCRRTTWKSENVFNDICCQQCETKLSEIRIFAQWCSLTLPIMGDFEQPYT